MNKFSLNPKSSRTASSTLCRVKIQRDSALHRKAGDKANIERWISFNIASSGQPVSLRSPDLNCRFDARYSVHRDVKFYLAGRLGYQITMVTINHDKMMRRPAKIWAVGISYTPNTPNPPVLPRPSPPMHLRMKVSRLACPNGSRIGIIIALKEKRKVNMSESISGI
ncbi:hypothetical protein RRG08_048141 [Elysia crispata]|uniref:Uncharacterized protein n=1 Tax=Elysia crispata TaxID=231223 RepID=A0AAE0ZJJ3_9GAST|nr:hypothetical protein RRG08_048141 [Elysia crispata]